MQRWLRILLVVFLILAAGATAIYWFGFPQVESLSPADGSAFVAAGMPIRLVFSHRMEPDSVMERLRLDPALAVSTRWEEKTLVISPEQAWKAGSVIRVELLAGAKSAGLVSLPVRQAISATFTVRQPRLAYLYPANSAANIYVIAPGSAEQLQLTRHPAGVQDFWVSGNGAEIYYSAKNDLGGSDIYRLVDYAAETPAVTGEPLEVVPELLLGCLQASCRVPVASPAGDFLAYERTEIQGDPQVWYMQLTHGSGGSEQGSDYQPSQVFHAGDPTHQTYLPSWSPGGWLSFYDYQAKAYIFINPHTQESLTFHNETGQAGGWHPDGIKFVAAEITFLNTGEISDLQSFANSHLIMFNRSTSSTQDLTPGEEMEDSSPAFSPDGTYLAFARKYLDKRRWTPGRQLWIMMPGIGQAQPVTSDPNYTHFEFAWSPDGNQLAYVRFNQTALTEPPEIWLLDLLSLEKKLLVTGGYLPQWLP